MIRNRWLSALILSLTPLCLIAQEWRQYTADDAVRDFIAYKDDLWITSGSGLTKLDMNTLEKTTWNILNSDLPDYQLGQMAVDSNGTLWMEYNFANEHIILNFDGANFEKFTQLQGEVIRSVNDIETASDGTLWIMARTTHMDLYRYAQSQFTPVTLPDTNWIFDRQGVSHIITDTSNHVWTVIKDTLQDINFIGEYDGVSWTLHNLSSYAVVPEGDDEWAIDPLGRVVLFCKDRNTPALMRWDGSAWTRFDLPDDAIQSSYVRDPLQIDDAGHIRILLDFNAYLYFDGISWSTISLEPLGLENGFVYKLYQDGQSRWWFTKIILTGYLEEERIYMAAGSTTQLIDLSNGVGDLPTNQLFSIYIDRSNHKWMLSGQGLLSYDGQSWITIKPAVLDNFYSFFAAEGPELFWYINSNQLLSFFDGVASFQLPIMNEEGEFPEFIKTYSFDADGRIFISPSAGKIIVFDHGTFTYLPQTIWWPTPFDSIPDHPRLLAHGPGGTLYAFGNNLYRFEEDSTWTTMSTDALPDYPYEMWVRSDTTVCVSLFHAGPNMFVYYAFDGQTWNEINAPGSLFHPQEDSHGDLWIAGSQGLCHQVNDTWICYDRSNSPVIPERLRRFEIDRYDNVWIVMDDGGLLLFNPVAIVDAPANTLPVASGTVYRDLNQNGAFDAGDTPLPLQRQLMLPDNVLAFSSYSGQYKIMANNGDHEVKYVPSPNWHIDNSPAAYNITVSDQSVTHLDFALAPDEEKVDLNLFLSEGSARCNSLSRYTLTSINWGTMAEELKATLVLDSSVTPHEINPQPDAIHGDTLSWHFSNLLPFQTISVTLDLRMPGVQQEEISFIGYLDRIVLGQAYRTDSINITQKIRCSFDPNDKIARSTRNAGDGKTYPDAAIDYTIRFQNTGNDTAFQIIIRDTLDASLDANSLEILASSHPYEAYLKPDRTLEFRFYKINLPDSTTNELESHGFVSYRIRPLPGLTVPVLIQNTAHIYFDYNGSIQTNTTNTELVEFATSTYDASTFGSLIHAYPNPADQELWLDYQAGDQMPVEYTLLGMDGHSVFSGTLHTDQRERLSLGSLPAGIYILHASSGHVKGSILVVKGQY